jgi:hypothetical protein
MALDTLDKKKQDDEQEEQQPDVAAPLRADVMGSIAGANPNDPGYLEKVNHLITAHGALERMGDASTMGMSSPIQEPNQNVGQEAIPTTMGPAKPQRGWLGKIGQVASRIGNIAGDVLAPGTMAMIPGTDLNKRAMAHQQELAGERKQRLGIEQEQADTAKQGMEQKPELAELTGELRGQQQERRLEDQDRRTQEQITARDKEQREREAASAKAQEERNTAADERQQNQFAEQNKLADQRDAAAEQRLQETIKAHQDLQDQKDSTKKQASEDAVTYATNYLQNGVFTGPGDEALQEKFFELAKPTTGFRMTDAQMKMLRDSRSWMGGIEGHLRHATTGQWFSDEQRQQIVNTMKELDAAKKSSGQGGAPSANSKWQSDGKGNYRYSNDGGKTWTPYKKAS